jgi:acetoin utilization deacetylase AcuC-like enzyme
MSWLRAQERTRNFSENPKINIGWPKRSQDNKFKESIEQVEKLDIEFMMPKVHLKHRMQQNTNKS